MPETVKSYGQYQNEVMQDGVIATGRKLEVQPIVSESPAVQAGGSAEEMAQAEQKNNDFESMTDEEKYKKMWGK